MTTNALTIDLNNVAAIKSFADTDFTMAFKPITSAQDIADAIAFGEEMESANLASAGLSTKLLYWDFARIVHLAQEVQKNPNVWQAFNDACHQKGVSVPKEDANLYIRHAELLMGTHRVGQTPKLDGKWRNNLRAVRYLVESNVRPQDVPATITAAVARDSNGQTLTRLLALNELDKQAHKPKSSTLKKSSPYGKAVTKGQIEVLPPILKSATPIELNFNSEGFALAVVRKGANDIAEVLYDARLADKFVMKGVRDGFKAIV
ncbi:hypothetical protein AS026_19415 [Rhizobium altiplani]|uniref:Uncharacterized protein n=1 Tax=Rhizobium altiplani TaxID=1864509 RepID=A0A109J7L9_9HYPH|nr:hypothetical protein [Rhizobium altiplani]KWV43842.1 hypothetical protein AS026_19415 [Rhizobium altiplani]